MYACKNNSMHDLFFVMCYVTVFEIENVPLILHGNDRFLDLILSLRTLLSSIFFVSRSFSGTRHSSSSVIANAHGPLK